MPAGLSYNHQTIALDGEAYDDCEFTSCKLIYSGGALPQFDGCKFTACDWTFQQAAADTLSYLKVLWGVGEKATVQAAIKEITVVAR